MRVKRVLLQAQSLDGMADDFKRAWKKAARGEALPVATETLCFESAEEMQKFLSPERIRLIRTVHLNKPDSIVALAALLGRDRKNVTDDVKLLESVGLIERKSRKPLKRGKGKAKVELVVGYDRIRMDIAV